MAKFCKYCGDSITEGEVFCDNCGKRIEKAPPSPPPPPPKPVCANCGTELKPGAKFCRNCGTPVATAAAPAAAGTPPSLPASRRPPPLPAAKTPPGHPSAARAVPPPPVSGMPTATPPKKRGKKGCCGCLFGLAAIMMAVLGALAFFYFRFSARESLDGTLQRWCKEYSGGAGEAFLDTDFAITKETSPGNPRLIRTTWSELDVNGAEVFTADVAPGAGSVTLETSAGMVGVDFASLNPEEKEDALIVRILPELHDANSGMTLHGYDFSLESGRHAFAARNRITIPRRVPDNKDGQVYYYNPESGEYEFVYFEVSDDGKSYHAYLDHFSIVVEGVPDYFIPSKSTASLYRETEHDRSWPVMARSVEVTDKDLKKWMEGSRFDLAKLCEKGVKPTDWYLLFIDTLSGGDFAKSALGMFEDVADCAERASLDDCVPGLGSAILCLKVSYQLTKDPSQGLWKAIEKNKWDFIATGAMVLAKHYGLGIPAGTVIVAASITWGSYGLLQSVRAHFGEPPVVSGWEEAAYQRYLCNWYAPLEIGGIRYAVGFWDSDTVGNGPREARRIMEKAGIELAVGRDYMHLAVRDILLKNQNDPDSLQTELEMLKIGYLRHFWNLEPEARRNWCFKYYVDEYIELHPYTVAEQYGRTRADIERNLRPKFLAEYKDPSNASIKSYIENHETYIDKCIQSRIRAVLWDDFCKKQETLKKLLADKVLPALNDRIYFHVKDPTLPKGAHFDQSPYSAYHKDREIKDYARYMRFLDAKGRSVKAGALLGFAFYPNNADKSEYGEESFQPYPRENTDLVFHCTRYHYMQMGAPGWLVLNGRQTWPEVRIPIDIPPPDGSGTTRVELAIPNEALKADLRRFTGAWVPIEMHGKLQAQDWIIGLVYVEKYNEFCEFEGPAGRITTSLRSWMEIKHFDFDERTGVLTIDFVKNNPDRGQDTATFQIDRSDRLTMKNSGGTYVFLRQPPAESAFGPDFAQESAAFLEKVREDSAKAPRDRPVGFSGRSVATAGTITLGGK